MRLSTALALFLCSMNALAQLSVVEPATRAVLVDGHTTISLAFNNLGPQTVDVRVSLQWLSPDGQVDGKGQRDVTLPPGNSAVSIPHPLCDKCDPLVERLEYLVSPTSSNYTAFAPVSGRLSLPNIAKHAFALSVLTAGFPAPNQPFEVRVLAAHPLSGQPIPGVEVTSDQATAVTGEDGIALLHVTREPDDEGTIDVTGQIGDFKADAESTPLPNKKQQIRGYTDKPIYQPGQTMHLRILALDERGRAEEGREFELRIVDESDELNFNAKIKTSRFGIASTDWEIPQGVEPGRYTINLKTDETDRYFLHQVSIRRYELPSFRVAVAPDRPFYLINQPAHVEIRGEYLFRKPVSSGKVRIVKANEEDKAIAEGALDSHGRFSATLDTTAKLAASQKFEDHHYIAFLTDLSTNRTEQCKFDLRISRDPVHIYAIRQESNAAGRHLYITTYSPDGTPLRSQVEIGNAGSVLGRGRTNRFGLTRIDLPAAKPDDEAESLEIRATTDNGLRARMDLPSASGLPPYRREPTLIWLRTDRTLYRAGEAVKCVIGSAKPEHPVLLIAFNDKDQVVFTKSVRLNNGRVAVEIPYDKRFGRALNVGVATATARDTLPVRRVYFPGSTDLVIKATPAQPAYRPGDTATIQFEASSQAALGIAIVDQSVLERASTDSAFGRRHWFEGPDSRQVNLGGITEADLLNLDPASIHDVDLQLVAEVLSPDAGSLVNSARDVMKEIQEAFEKGVSKGLAPVVQAINEHYMETLEFPRDDASLHRIVGHALRQVQDPWMQAYYARFSISGPYAVVTFLSGGPDKLQSTADD
ncbi:MAG TPA: MG2 domain-containing protein, partial [Bryobacteraceae bacterium]|nr:MG2 domain-containing protein [Bryobacteraceae bacterium]